MSDEEWISHSEEGWSPLPLSHLVASDNYVSGDPDGNRLRVQYFLHDGNGSLICKVWFGPGAQGPPGHAHGGSIAATLDEAMGAAAWIAGHTVVAAELTIRFRRMLPLGSEYLIAPRVAEVQGRKVRTKTELKDRRGQVFAEGEALFVVVHPGRFGELVDSSIHAPGIGPRRGITPREPCRRKSARCR